MTQRKLFIGPSTIGQMEVVEEISNEELFINPLNLPKIDTYTITFDYLIQCGVDTFATSSLEESDRFVSTEHEKRFHDFLKEKTVNISKTKVYNAYNSIENIFQYYLPDNYYKVEKYHSIWGLKALLQDLMVASSTGTSLFRRIDTITQDLEKARDLIPLELFLPIKFLINSICQDTVDLPYVRHFLNKDDIKRFEKVFESKDFLEYKLAHSILDVESSKKKSAISKIQEKSINLYHKYSGLVNIKRGILTTLSVTPKLVDSTFGKLPGSIADSASKILTNIIATDRRIILYDYGPIYNEIYWERIILPLKEKIREEEEQKRGKK
jgi:hypothetical protein